MTDTPTPPEGWYPDPAGSGGTRRWDGAAWTDEVRPAVSERTDAAQVDAPSFAEVETTAVATAGESQDETEAAAPAASTEHPAAPTESVPSPAPAPTGPSPAASDAPAEAAAPPASTVPAAPATPAAPSATTTPAMPTTPAAPAAPAGTPAYSTAPGYPGAAAASAPGYPASPGYGAAPGYPAAPGYAGASTPATPAKSGVPTDTVWVWLIVALPLVQLLSVFLVDWRSILEQAIYSAAFSESGGYSSSMLSASVGTTLATLGVSVLSLVIAGLSILFAFLDWRQLRARGIQNPFHWAWAFFVFLISSGVYVIGRGIVLRRQTGKGLGPIWGFIAVTVVSLIAATIWAVVVLREVFALIEQVAYYYSY